MKYIANHSYRFEYPYTGFLLCLSEIIMQLVVEWVCILVCCISLAPMAIVFNFIALALVADFDNLMFEALKFPLALLVHERSHEEGLEPILIIEHTTSIRCGENEISRVMDPDTKHFRPLRVKFSKRTPGNMVAFAIYKICKTYYSSFYFYFNPYLVFVLQWIVPQIWYVDSVDI